MRTFIYSSSVVLVVCAIFLYYNREPEFDEGDVFGKKVLVTGASSGIGEHLAYEYARMGADVFVTARREKLLQKVVSECKRIGRHDAVFGYIVADMEQYEDTARKVVDAAVQRLGGLDHLIINHAIFPEFRYSSWHGDQHDLRYLKKSMDINFFSFAHLATYALPHLKKSDHGRLGIISSLAGKVETIGMAPYTSSKFALDGFFSTLRTELVHLKTNVTVTLCPLGFIETDMGLKSNELGTKTFGLDEATMRSLVTWADVTDTALRIIQAVTLGHRELYYPPVLGIDQDTKLIPIIRHIAPSLLDTEMNMFRKKS